MQEITLVDNYSYDYDNRDEELGTLYVENDDISFDVIDFTIQKLKDQWYENDNGEVEFEYIEARLPKEWNAYIVLKSLNRKKIYI